MNKLELKELSKRKNKDLILIDKKSYKNQAKVSKIYPKYLGFLFYYLKMMLFENVPRLFIMYEASISYNSFFHLYKALH